MPDSETNDVTLHVAVNSGPDRVYHFDGDIE